jgi:glycosyltransferase involved in cell wall biosynthesis
MEYNIRLFFFLLFHGFDLICSIDLDTIIPVTLIARLKRKLHVHDAHELFEESIEIVKRPKIRAFWEWVGNRFVPMADHHYTVNQSLANFFEKKYKRPFQVILNAPTGATTIKNSSEKPSIVLYQGMLNEGRGLELLVEVTRILPIELWIVGEGSLMAILEGLVLQYGLESKVKFWGFKSGKALKKITGKADIGVNILDPLSGNYTYSLANRTFDFIQAGIPAIHMNFPEYQKINDQFKIAELINEYSVDAICAGLNKLIEDKQYYQELHENCKQAALAFHWDNEKIKLLELYRNWLESNP